MVRGIYTGASSMVSKMIEMNVIANNLANVNTTGFKRDQTLFKAFPEMLIRRTNDNGVHSFPLGSWDTRPVVGKLGTGVETNELYTRREQGSLTQTRNNLDIALEGKKGFFVILTGQGERYSRNGSFTINKEGLLVTKEGDLVLGKKGPIYVKHNNILVSDRGEVHVDENLQEDKKRPVQAKENSFKNAILLDELQIVDFPRTRYLKKEGHSFFSSTNESGKSFELIKQRPLVKQGFLENSNVNAINEMVQMITVQRAYEASQKTITAHDDLLDKLINKMTRV